VKAVLSETDLHNITERFRRVELRNGAPVLNTEEAHLFVFGMGVGHSKWGNFIKRYGVKPCGPGLWSRDKLCQARNKLSKQKYESKRGDHLRK